ncbi:helix-turn-helix domain-containing protein [Ideonella azotifigens]|uniref:Helix-turn-helix transcriptional regulator n=1 Tax=Ideonella azotifigens TaxID=513160 RepID=A0ABP3UZ37_9BURK|nr:helix-turn-helix transcriptional regulator [Ideonella azotifigens]MCD2339967.1 helix-turn-helix domain-containing protein [Ideonella azotifigens]
MASTQALIQVIKNELKAAGLTYAALAGELQMAESSVKRMFSRGEMPLSRVDEICRVLKTDFAALSRQVAEAQPERRELTLEQERAVVADRKLLLVAICCMSQWSLEQMVGHYRITEPEVIRHLAQLDRLGIIALRPLNRYRLQLAKGFRWRPHGPVMQFFREDVVQDFYSGGFDGEAELLALVHGQVAPRHAIAFQERLQRLAQDFAQQHLSDRALPADQKRPMTLLIGMRAWLFGAFRDMKR